MADTNNYNNLAPDMFELVGSERSLSDKKLDTRPIGYFRDAFNRFSKNKSSVVAAIIILFLLAYAIFVPLFCETTYSKSLTDTTYLKYNKLMPRSELFSWLGWDGCQNVTMNSSDYYVYSAIGIETGYNPIVKEYRSNYADESTTSATTFYDVKLDSYYKKGMFYLTLTKEQYDSIQQWQDENQIQVIYPAVDTSSYKVQSFKNDANHWYALTGNGNPVIEDGELVPLYYTRGTDDYFSNMRIEGDDGSYRYARITGDSTAISYRVRVFSYTYFMYRYGEEPSFLFGTNAYGQDIFTRLASGARFSFLLAICVSAINLFIGTIYGAIQGYYGGAIDMIMDRICDVLSGVPFMVVATLFQLHLMNSVGPVVALLFAFVLTGWIGMAYRVRMQFYRFKGQEYILAARTLGARDRRLMFKHILPNSLGTIITGSILIIPGVIFTESTLTYLGIVNLESSTMTSVGTMLAAGRDYLYTDPYIILFPALFISLLEISFNLFGNGLRDAFNPSLRGVDD